MHMVKQRTFEYSKRKWSPIYYVIVLFCFSQKTCLKLTCPLLQTPIHGQCVPVLSGTRQLGVRVILAFTPKWVKTNNASQAYDFNFDSAARNLSKIVGKGLGRCRPCEHVVFAKYSNKTAAVNGNMLPERFSMSLAFYTSEECQESLIVQRINELLAKEIKLPIGSESMTLIISTVPKEKYTQYTQLDQDMLLLTSVCPMRIIFASFDHLSRCPFVSLNFTDYNNLMKSTKQMSKKRLINAMFKQTANEGNVATNMGNDATNMGNDATNMGNVATSTGHDTTNMGNDATNREDNNFTNVTKNAKVQVCVETYLSVLPKKNQGMSSSPEKMILFVMVITASHLWA